MSDTSNLPMAVEPAADKAPIPALPRIKTSPAIKRFNDCVVTALGSAQRDWLLSVKGLDGPPVSEEAEAAERNRRADARFEHQLRRRQLNLDAILLHAFARLPEKVDEGDIDPDWAARLFDICADCADPERQAIWARLLIMEVRRPGAVPPVAMRVLASLSPRLTEWLRVIAGLTINNFFVRLSDEFNAERGLVGDVILLLEEYGLLRTNKDTTKVFRSQIEAKFTTNLLYNDKILRIIHDDPKKEMVVPCYRLTDAGSALCTAIIQEENITTDMEYIIEIVRHAQRQGCTVMQADILKRASENVVSKHSPFSEIVALHTRRGS
ncbi:MAG: DUF2806 domain-containing protein [Alphaproteobacteria bacterium]|nr:DUF2806 domain-containing protein [Alphaproteobacteria bacterium]